MQQSRANSGPDQPPPPSLAIVIPTFNSAKTLAPCLDSILSQDVSPEELVIVDDVRTTDTTRAIAQTRNVMVIVSRAGMAESRNVGVQMTAGQLILSLDSDMILEPGLLRTLLAEFASKSLDGASIAERSVGSGYWSRGRAIDKMSVEATGYGRSLRVFTRRLFTVLAGYDPRLEAGEDADFHRRAINHRARIAHISHPGIAHLEGDLKLVRVARKKYQYGTTLPAFEAKHGRTTLARGYGRRLLVGVRLGLVSDPLAVPGFLVLKATDVTAGILGRRSALRSHIAGANQEPRPE